jgi:hypothetical protein
MHNNSLGDAAASRQGIVAQESEDAGHVLDVGSPAPFLPIHDRYLVAIDDCRDIDLSQVEVEPPFANRLTDGFINWKAKVREANVAPSLTMLPSLTL